MFQKYTKITPLIEYTKLQIDTNAMSVIYKYTAFFEYDIKNNLIAARTSC